MDGSLEPAPIQAMPDNPRKRAASRSPSISPSDAQQLKKIRYGDDFQDINDHVMFQPAPIRSFRPSAALLEYIKETLPRPSYLEKIDNWLQDICPPDLRKISRSDCFILDKYADPIFLERYHSAPAIMSGRTKLTGRAATLRLSATSKPLLVPSIPTLGTEEGYSGLPTLAGTPSRFTGPLVENPLYRDSNLAFNNIFLLDSRTKLPDHLAALVESLKRARSSPEPDPTENNGLYAMEAGASEAEVKDFFRESILPPDSKTGTIKRSDRVFVSKCVMPVTKPHLKLSIPVPDMLFGYRFTALELEHGNEITSCGNFAIANNEGLTFPFLAVEFKGDGPSSKGSL
ncbi:hypothetical protein FGADI_517 [Fusarium gaditjirri]|uniref:Uncharacterized protein n=1 Tax=Fusarium gaditjirri TaxID=282569 RepID=A0A8H4TND1_9HYPO|nr:hypothetical protein FGADI_517 [Fusarium gaditjirri]